jgi:Ser/Thr protein kinase RdoA (MazF antagonist)
VTVALAYDPAFPQREALLNPDFVGSFLASRLKWAGGITRSERVRATYRIGASLRILHRFEAAGRTIHVAARGFQGGRSAHAYEKALASEHHVNGSRSGVVHGPDLDAVFWLFPNDRRLPALQTIGEVRESLSPYLPRPWAHSRLVAWAPERSATFQCLDADGVVLAYAKVGPGARSEYERYLALADVLRQSSVPLLVPRAIAFSSQRDTVLIEAVPGQRLAYAQDDLRAMGVALGQLHSLPVPNLPRFTRLSASSRRAAADLVTRALPMLEQKVGRLNARLARLEPVGDALGSLHGDVHPRNVMVSTPTLALIDVEEMARGARAADMGSLLARLCCARIYGEQTAEAVERAAMSFLNGYAEVATLPDGASLKWHTAAALFVERVQRAVIRFNELALQHIDALIDEVNGLLDSREGLR